MKKYHKNSTPGFNVWQGYVSSISSLLIALLMLMGILGMATAVIQDALDKGKISQDSNGVECRELVNCKKEAVPTRGFAEVQAASSQKMLELLLTNQKSSGTQGHRFQIQFPADMQSNNRWELDLQKNLKTYTSLKNAIWQIYTLADTSDAQLLRNAYLRNLTVRQALMQAGVKAEAIETLIDTEHTAGNAQEKASVVLTVVFD